MASQAGGVNCPWTTATIAAAAAGYVVVHRLGRTSGSTRAERSRPLPGDEPDRWTISGDQPCRTPAGATARGVALADPTGLAPWRLVHAPVGGPAVLPGQLAER